MTKLLKVMALSVMGMGQGFAAASASQVISMDSHKRLEATVAKDYLNRIAVTNDRITQVFGDEEAYVIQVDESSGQVFLKPSDLNGSKPISLTLITENGQTQDLTLKPFEKEASTLLLKPTPKTGVVSQEEAPQGKYETPHQSPLEKSISVQEKLIQAMKMLALGQLPPLEGEVKERSCPDGMTIKGVKSYQIGSFKGHTYEVENTTETLMDIDDKTFYQTGDLALSFQKRVLKSNETTLLSVMSR